MTEELETEVLISQVCAFKDIIMECESLLMSNEEVQFLAGKTITMVTKSLERIEENNKMKK